jgi:hypothetical protein
LTRSAGFKDLGEPGPENPKMAEAALAQGRINSLGRMRVSAQRAAGNNGGKPTGRGLQTTFGDGKNHKRKVGQERLLGHTP